MSNPNGFPIDTYQKLEEIVSPDFTSSDHPICIITLEGEFAAGKDVYASALARLAKSKGYVSEVLRFADPVRDSVCRDLGISEQVLDSVKRYPFKLWDSKIEVYNTNELTMRDALIHVAETNKSRYGKFFYANIMLNRINNELELFRVKSIQRLRDSGDQKSAMFIIIPDLRFKQEMEALQALSIKSSIELKQIAISTTKQPHDLTLPPIKFI